MTKSQHNRRNFLSTIAILSAGTAFGPAIKHFPSIKEADDLVKMWTSFWEKSGGQVKYNLADLVGIDYKNETKGHQHKNGEIIYFPKENILAQPTWIFWENDLTKPADVIVTLIENNYLFKRIIRFNRFEMDALYFLSNKPGAESLLLSSINNSKPIGGASTGIIRIRTTIKKNSQIQDISYYKGQVLVFEDKIIHHT